MLKRIVLAVSVLLVLVVLFLVLRPNAPNTGPQARSFDLSVHGGNSMAPSEITVAGGDQVTLRVTSDQPLDLHLHGYDIEKQVEAGKTTTIAFEAKLTGSFEMENEQTQTKLCTLIVQPRGGAVNLCLFVCGDVWSLLSSYYSSYSRPEAPLRMASGSDMLCRCHSGSTCGAQLR